LPVSPPIDLGPKPELDPSFAEIQHRAGHVRVPALVEANAVAMGEAEDVCYGLGID
jgi:hypothetical protein